MTYGYQGEQEPTHALPQELKEKLIEANAWFQERPDPRDPTSWIEWQSKGALLLMDVVELVDEAWGFSRDLS